MIFQRYMCKIREKASAYISRLINEIRKTKTLEKNIPTNDTKKLEIKKKKLEKTHRPIRLKHNIRNSMYESIPHIKHLCFHN